MRKTEETTITTPLTPTTPLPTLLALLHDHDFLIHVSPSVISFTLTTGSATSTATYSVTDKKPIGRTTYELTITPCGDGVDTLVLAHPPPGLLRIESRWRVVGEGEGARLVEDVRVEANRIMAGKVRENIQVTHKEQHQRFIEEAIKRG